MVCPPFSFDRRMLSKPMIRGLFTSMLFSIGFGVIGSLKFLLLAGPHSFNDPVIQSLFCFGLLLGSVLAFDKESSINTVDAPFMRIGIGGLSGVLFALSWQWPVAGIAAIGIFSAALGGFGMSWAKHIAK